MGAFALFSEPERNILKPLYRQAAGMTHPDKADTSPQAQAKANRETSALRRMFTELIDVVYVSPSTLREIEASSPLGSVQLGDNVIPLDRNCKPYQLDSLRLAIIGISRDIAAVLGNDTQPFKEMEARKLEHGKANYAKMVDYRYALNWVHELLDKDYYGKLDLKDRADKRFSEGVLLKDIMDLVFKLKVDPGSREAKLGVEPWQVTHAKNALRGLQSLIQKETLQINPYSVKENFDFPYTDPDEVLKELGYSDTEIAELKTKRNIFRSRPSNISDREVIWILLTFSEGNWDSAANSLYFAKEEKNKISLEDELFDYVINNEVEPLYYVTAMHLMAQARKEKPLPAGAEKPKLKSVQKNLIANAGPKDAIGSGNEALILGDENDQAALTVPLHDIAKIIAIYEKKKIDKPEADPVHYQKYRKPFLRYTRQYHALQDIAKIQATNMPILTDGGGHTPPTTTNLAATQEGSTVLVARETAVEREVIGEIKDEIDKIKGLDPDFLKDNFIPEDVEEIGTIIRSRAKGMDVYKNLNSLVQLFTKLREKLFIVINMTGYDYGELMNIPYNQITEPQKKYLDAYQEVIDSAEFILKKLHPDKKIIMGTDLDVYYEDLIEALDRLKKINPDFLEENGFPQTAYECKKLLKTKHGMEFGDKVKKLQSVINSAASDFEMANKEPAFKRSGTFARSISQYIEFLKTTLGLN